MTAPNVTERKAPVSSGASAEPSAERETISEVSSLQSEDVTVRDRLAGWVAGARAYWVPPRPLSNPPPSYAELVSYARSGGWTASTDGPVRAAGRAWLRLVALPVTVVARYIEWIFQRPGRAIPVFVLWRLFISTGGGPWIAEHIIRPACAVAAWVLL